MNDTYSKDLFFVDTETGGLDTLRHDIISIAVVQTDSLRSLA